MIVILQSHGANGNISGAAAGSIDPAVKGADYSVANILAEVFPTDQVTELYKQYAGAYATGQNLVNLALVSDLGK